MSTSLMPVDPALSPQQINRILPIRAELLPEEIINGRKARRMRAFVILGMVLVLVGLGGWYADAYHDRTEAQENLDAVSTEIMEAHTAMNRKDLAQITKTIKESGEVSDQLKALMSDDLPWSTLLDRLRATGRASKVTISQITASMADGKTTGAGGTGTAAGGGPATVATLVIEGDAADKTTIAGFIEKLGQTTGIDNPYLTAASQATGTTSGFMFTANADVTSDALCGRFTTPCKTGGK